MILLVSCRHLPTRRSQAVRWLGLLNNNQMELESLGGAGLFPAAAILEHSCSPTCSFTTTDDASVLVTCIRTCPAGARLSIDYGDLHYRPTRDRQSFTRDKYGFVCSCPRCTEQPDFARAFWCPSPQCAGKDTAVVYPAPERLERPRDGGGAVGGGGGGGDGGGQGDEAVTTAAGCSPTAVAAAVASPPAPPLPKEAGRSAKAPTPSTAGEKAQRGRHATGGDSGGDDSDDGGDNDADDADGDGGDEDGKASDQSRRPWTKCPHCGKAPRRQQVRIIVLIISSSNSSSSGSSSNSSSRSSRSRDAVTLALARPRPAQSVHQAGRQAGSHSITTHSLAR
jgi:hypothetical protein